jgi:hypothetical protein
VAGGKNAVAELIWRGLGETRSLEESSGLLLAAQNWNEQDQAEISPEHSKPLQSWLA